MRVRLLALATVLAAASSAHAEPGIVYRYSPAPKVKAIGVQAIVDLEPAMTETGSGCEQRMADLVIEDVVYDGASDRVVGFRAPKTGLGMFKMETDKLYKSLSNAERRAPLLLIRRGAKVLVTYQMCGSGGFISVRDVWDKSAINRP